MSATQTENESQVQDPEKDWDPADKEMFDLVIAITKRPKNKYNPWLASHTLSLEQNYDPLSAAFATLLALIAQDNAVCAESIMAGYRNDDGSVNEDLNVTSILDNELVKGIAERWAGRVMEPYMLANSATALVFFALTYDAYACACTLLYDDRISDQLSVGTYRVVSKAICNAIDQAVVTRTIRAREHVDKTVGNLLDNGRSHVISAKQLFAQQKALKADAARIENEEDENVTAGCSNAENIVAYSVKQLRQLLTMHKRFSEDLHYAHTMTTNFLVQLKTQQDYEWSIEAVANGDGDLDIDDKTQPKLEIDFNATDALHTVEVSIKEWDQELVHEDLDRPPTTAECFQEYWSLCGHLRRHLLIIKTLTKQERERLAENKKICERERHEKHRMGLDEMEKKLAMLGLAQQTGQLDSDSAQ